MLASEDEQKALTSPSSVFKHPADVVACADLSKAQGKLDVDILEEDGAPTKVGP